MTDTECYQQAMRELSNGRTFAELPPCEQSAVIQRAQEIKAQESRQDSI